MAEEKKITQTKSFFRLHGIIMNKDTVNSKGKKGFTEGKTKNNDNYRALKFMVKTSSSNMVPVEMFGMPRDKVYLYNKKLPKGSNTKSVAWKDRNKDIKDYELIKPEFDSTLEYEEKFKDGEFVCVVGKIEFSTYYDERRKETVEQTKYIMTNIYEVDATKKSTDLNSEDFEEDSVFEQEIIIDESIEMRDEEKLVVNAKVIGYKTTAPAVFEISLVENAKLARNIRKLKAGDFLKVSGIINNRAVKEAVESNEDEWGNGKEVKSITKYIKCLEINRAYPDTLEKKKYTMEELASIGKADEAKKINESKKTLENLEKLEDDDNNDNDDLPFGLDED